MRLRRSAWRSRVNSPGPKRTDSRKQAVSIRMSLSDIRHIKLLAKRLGARESDVLRFAIKTMLERLSPLQDPKAGGRSLVPVFMESGAELMRHFELDAGSLSGIINEGVEDDRRVEPDDIRLIAQSGNRRSPLHLGEAETREKSLQRYLYDKYFHGGEVIAKNGSWSAA